MAPARPQLLGDYGMVSSTHWLASAVGMSVLERGGNAFDAAAAAAFVLQVVEPHLNGLGGELALLFWSAESQRVQAVCGQGPAPAEATIDRFRSLGIDLIPGTGLLPACVPGAFGAWTMLLERYGTMELGDLLEPALGYASRGFPVAPTLHTSIEAVEELFREHWPTSAKQWLVGRSAPRSGTLHGNPGLADTYERLIREGGTKGTREARISRSRDAFYRGFVAEAIDAFVSAVEVTDATGIRHRGVITGDDMAAFQASVEEPLSYDYSEATVYKAPTWSQGLVLLQALATLTHTDIASLPRDSAHFVHLVVEAVKLALADREAWYGDPDFATVPWEELLSKDYSAARASLIGENASMDLQPGSPEGRRPHLAFLPEGEESTYGSGRDPGVIPPHGDTVHLDVADRWGNMVSATPSGGWLQSSPTVEGLGFCLGTRLQMFSLSEDLPNSLEGGKRPRSTLTPSLVLRDGAPWLAFGTPGGDNQDQWSLVFLLTLLHHDPDLQLAIDSPTFFTTHAPSSFYPRMREPGRLYVEGHSAATTIEDLRRRGHDLVVQKPWSQGMLSAVGLDATTGWLRGAANPRGRQGYAVGR